MDMSMDMSTGCGVRLLADLPTMAERELAAFTAAVDELFGAEQARVSAEDWIRELASAWDGGETARDLRQITIKAAARFAHRVSEEMPRSQLL